MTKTQNLKIGIIGSGISGMSAAWLLSQKHDVSVFEKDDRIGGHSNTINVQTTFEGQACNIGIDTGFIVFNHQNYPNLVALLQHLDVPSHATDMSFSVSRDQGKFEYAGSTLDSLFAQRRNLLSPTFWRMLIDIRRFYKNAPSLLTDKRYASLTLGTYLKQQGYSDIFMQDHILPMGAAIWSTPLDKMGEYPLQAFLQFCHNHGLLQIQDRPVWRSVVGGSQKYIEKLTAPYRANLHLNCAIQSAWQTENGVTLEDRNGAQYDFDHVIFASHPDQTLDILHNPTVAERNCLQHFTYQPNIAILHTDETLMPQRRKTWSSWNYLKQERVENSSVCVTYWMNCLQNLKTDINYFVTLNPTQMPEQTKIIRSFLYHHPVFTHDSLVAQKQIWALQGKRRFWYCGAYLGHGFHEDGVQAGLAVAEALGGLSRPWATDRPADRLALPENWPPHPVKKSNDHKVSP